MLKFGAGFLFGIVIATVGFSGVASLADHGVNTAKATLQEQVKK